jgi:hypothetical protein
MKNNFINENDVNIGAVGAIITAILLPKVGLLSGEFITQAETNVLASLAVFFACVFLAHLSGLTK